MKFLDDNIKNNIEYAFGNYLFAVEDLKRAKNELEKELCSLMPDVMANQVDKFYVEKGENGEMIVVAGMVKMELGLFFKVVSSSKWYSDENTGQIIKND